MGLRTVDRDGTRHRCPPRAGAPGGSPLRHCAMASGQRGWKGQPGGRSVWLVSSLASPGARRESGAMRGIASMRARV